MKTVVEPKGYIVRLWGKQHVDGDLTYRLMRYVLRADHEDKVLLHNVVTGQLVLLNDEEAKMLSNLPARLTEPIQELIMDHFLVPEDFDEYRTVNQLRRIFQSRTTGDAINHYVILPTTFCNAHCFYCYESDYPRVHMSAETGQKLIEYIADHHMGKKVKISWFGGEPLVGMARIDQICQGLKERNIPYVSSMISNGYLFDENIIEKAVSLWNLKDVQITLDGTESVYNKTKAYVNALDNPFQRVLGNINLLSGKEVHVTIRLNLDFYNMDDIHALIEKLGHQYSGNSYVTVYLNKLFNHQGYEPVHHTQDDVVTLMDIIDQYTERLIELKLGYERRKMIPSLTYSQCMADNSHTIEIQPDGSFCRCEHESILDKYGSLEEGVLDPQKLLIWKENIERSDYCSECVIYPACFTLSRCMNADSPCVEKLRMKNLKAHKELLLSVYQKSMEGKTNEEV